MERAPEEGHPQLGARALLLMHYTAVQLQLPQGCFMVTAVLRVAAVAIHQPAEDAVHTGLDLCDIPSILENESGFSEEFRCAWPVRHIRVFIDLET